MASDRRSVDRKEIDAMTRDFLSRGGKIVQCDPGPSENVVTRNNGFRRRRPAEARPGGQPGADAAPPQAGGPDGAGDRPAEGAAKPD